MATHSVIIVTINWPEDQTVIIAHFWVYGVIITVICSRNLPLWRTANLFVHQITQKVHYLIFSEYIVERKVKCQNTSSIVYKHPVENKPVSKRIDCLHIHFFYCEKKFIAHETCRKCAIEALILKIYYVRL